MVGRARRRRLSAFAISPATHAALSLQAGVYPKAVSERLGHASVSITLETYSHAIPAMQEEAAAKVAALVFGA